MPSGRLVGPWTGALSKNWGVAGNWIKSDQSTPSVPVGVSNINIPNTVNDPEIGFDTKVSCNNLTIAPGASLTVKSTADGTGTLITNGTVTGDLTIERYVSGSTVLTAKKYHLVSIPLAPGNNSLSDLFMGSYLFKYNNDYYTWDAIGTSTTDELDETVGYMIYYPGEEKTYSFTGQPNTGTFSPTVSYNSDAGDNNFALVPNPYPSNIVWNSSSWTKDKIGPSIWVFNSSVGNYASWDGSVGTLGGSNIIDYRPGLLCTNYR